MKLQKKPTHKCWTMLAPSEVFGARVENFLDTRYMCVSMEHINYTPISWESAKIKFEERKHGE